MEDWGVKLATLAFAVLLAAPAVAECPHKPNGPCVSAYWNEATAPAQRAGEFTIPVSLVYLPGYTSSFAWAEPSERPQLDGQVHHTLGLAAGLGYRFANGFAVSGQLLRTHTHLDARWVVPDFEGAVLERSGVRSRTGVVVTVEIPLGGGR